MDNKNDINIGKIYKDLITYLSNIGYSSCTNYSEENVFIQLTDATGNKYLQFRLDYKYKAYDGYDYNNLQVAWRLLSVSSFSAPHKFPKDMDQRVMFEIILSEITNWKLQNIDKVVTKKVDQLLNSDVITEWLKTKEEQIKIEERAKVENHLSINEFRQVIKEELSKISINLKIGDK